MGVYPCSPIVQELPQLFGGMVDSDHVAGIRRRNGVCIRDLGAGTLDIELSHLRLPKVARDTVVLFCFGFRSVRQYVSGSTPPSDRVIDSRIPYTGLLRSSDPTRLPSSSSASLRGLFEFSKFGWLEY